jgi:LacI family transcriptional regulator
VSRVINGEAQVRAETRDRVQRAIVELSYHPNLSARGLAGGRSHLIGLLMEGGAPESEYHLQLMNGAVKTCQNLGYHLVIHFLHGRAQDFESQVNILTGNIHLDGYVLPPPFCDNDYLLAALDRKGCAYARMSPFRDPGRGPHVLIDDAGAAFDLTQHLIELGHRDIAFLMGDYDHRSAHLRLGGYSSALRSAGLPLTQRRIKQGDFTIGSGTRLAEELLNSQDPPTAIFASNDEMALGVLATALRLGIDVPGQLSICGFDDLPISRVVWPALTTVRQPTSAMSGRAAELLITRNREPKAHQFDYEIMRRGSTGPCVGAA